MQTAYVEPSTSPIPYRVQIASRLVEDIFTLSKQAEETVYLVSEEEQVHRETAEALEDLGIEVVSAFSEEEYLSMPRNDAAACLILDMQLCGNSGLEVQRRLLTGLHPPVIFVSEPSDTRTTVSAMKCGAIDFLTRPVDARALQAAIRTAFDQDYRTRPKKAELERLQRRLSLLTPREREVLPLVVGGLLNKQSASLLDISEVTLQIHRSQVMKKMAAESLADLVRMALKLRVPHWREN
ncbi:FixJ family two-component response regulator [Granulicella aggregans]|uniref:FixJ family two-component response regulator n=1 Tax=Granulicella aggregans TaxID=474949 RepID=A0A7W7ZJV7_9BACT|nr:LuxR C-terminal-related transcriptional regulator [Granulicella aggregans]MBB5060899.1 FixJ family two-component response regulator [Granulicella aggregans]